MTDEAGKKTRYLTLPEIAQAISALEDRATRLRGEARLRSGNLLAQQLLDQADTCDAAIRGLWGES